MSNLPHEPEFEQAYNGMLYTAVPYGYSETHTDLYIYY